MDPNAVSNCTIQSIGDFFTCGAGVASEDADKGVAALAAAVAGSFASLGAQLLIFIILRLRLYRIYRPRSYLVPERERVPQPPGGVIGWLYPVFSTDNLTLIKKCGLDAFFFLRFLRMMLKIFFPAALVVIPILLPLNKTGGGGGKGLDEYIISNIGEEQGNRLWAHCILAIIFIAWFCYVVYQELRGYIRVRQAFLTSPQHRIRASATTVLVTGIPQKWLTLEALSGLYDVFPGGIRNIWINRNFDELADKVSTRDKIARSLEDAETVLIKLCREKHAKAEKQRAKKEGRSKTSEEKKQDKAQEDAAAEQMAAGHGTSAGQHRESVHGMQDMLNVEDGGQDGADDVELRVRNPLGLVGHGFGAVGHGLGTFGKGVGKFGGKVVGGVDSSLHKAEDDFNRAAQKANDGSGFVIDDSLYATPVIATGPSHRATENQAPIASDSNRVLTAHSTNVTPRQDRQPLTLDGIDETSGREDLRHNVPTTAYSNRTTERPSGDSKPKSSLQIEEPPAQQRKVKKGWSLKSFDVFKNQDKSLALESPQPHVLEEDEFPLYGTSEKQKADSRTPEVSASKWTEKLAFWKSSTPETQYPGAFDKEWDEDQDEEPRWREFMEPKDRETMRLPLIFPSWFPSLPFVGQKVDRIYWLRRELARLNLEIETDQDAMDKFPLMNSAFIQFNHQVAAHMCCQSLSHHIPRQMAPRLVEISPDDVIWDNMAVKWWERYLRTGLVLVVCAGLIILYAVPVVFTSFLSNITGLGEKVHWLKWLTTLPQAVQGIIEGILPPVLLTVILIVVPIIFRLLIKQQGVPTGNAKEQGVQTWFFAFLFIQVFLVVTISTGIISFFQNAAEDPGSVVRTLADNLPKASNYFFSYLTVQALSNSASALLQVGSLLSWFILAPLFDSTARAKWRRQTNLNNIQWGSFFPTYTNFAAIGLVYSIISPLILVFMLFIYGLFWIVYRYNILFVFQFRNDTGGLLFPTAVNQLFTGIYFLELCLIGLFFTLLGPKGQIVALPQAIIMIVVLIFTATYQWLLNVAFKPLFQYLPITLEDEAVIRDEEFARAQASKFAPLNQAQGEDVRDTRGDAEDAERFDVTGDTEKPRRSDTLSATMSPSTNKNGASPSIEQRRWHDRKDSKPAWSSENWKRVAPEAVSALRFLADGKRSEKPGQAHRDPESQNMVGDVLFSDYADELEDLTPDERDLLVRYAFQHSAIRARRPVVWIPRDALGVSDDEIKRAKKMSTVEVESKNGGKEQRTNIWMSNEGTALDSKGHVVFRRSPPDFHNVDLIML